MVVIVTTNVADRFRGFLASCTLEIAPGVYTAPRMSKAVRERVWTVLCDWYDRFGGTSIVMTWRDSSLPCGQGLATLGLPDRTFAELDGGLVTTVTRKS